MRNSCSIFQNRDGWISIAITLARLLPDIADWRITILATNVNPLFRARRKAVPG